MRIEALLCDAATIREQLLHVLGGGITRMGRQAFPAPMNVQLALMLTAMPVEARNRHQLQIVLQDADGQPIANISAEFGLNPPPTGVTAGEPLNIPLVLPLNTIAIPRPGTYSVEILIDSQLARSLPFQVSLVPPPQAPQTPQRPQPPAPPVAPR